MRAILLAVVVCILGSSAAVAQFGNAGFVPNPKFDQDPPQLPEDLKAGGVLIFSKTSGYRDEPAMQASNAALAAICKERAWPFFVTENGAVMNAKQLGM